MSRVFRSPLVASLAGHGCVLALLILFAQQLQPILLPQPMAGIEVMLAPPPPPIPAAPPPIPEAAPPPPIPEAAPPPPEPAPPEPPPPVVEETPPPPPPPPKPIERPRPRQPPPRPAELARPLAPPPPAMLAPAPPQTAAIPQPAAPPVRPVVSAAYGAALSAWLESHKRYPENARANGEEGRALLRFRVDRAGRVLSFAIVQSTGHPDLDAAIDVMMQGATLPPFPADMTAPDIEVSVALHFGLAR